MRAISWSVRLLSPLLLLVGCATGRSSLGTIADVGSREVQNLERLASRDLSCPVGALYTRPVSDNIWEVTGCNATAEYSIVRRNLGGRRWTPVVPIAARAANELGCPPEGLVVEAAGPESRQVSGCGRSARYQLSCNSRACDWTLIDQGVSYRPASGVTVTPPRDLRTQPPSGVIVIPDQRVGGDAAEHFVRNELDRQRSAILSCAPGAPAVVLRASWARDGLVRVNIHPSTASFREIQPCVLGAIPQLQVTDGQTGDIIHVVR